MQTSPSDMDLPLTQVWGFKRAPLTWIYPSTSVGFQTSPSDLDLAGSSALGLPDRDQRLVDFGKAWSDRVKVRTRVNIYGTSIPSLPPHRPPSALLRAVRCRRRCRRAPDVAVRVAVRAPTRALRRGGTCGGTGADTGADMCAGTSESGSE